MAYLIDGRRHARNLLDAVSEKIAQATAQGFSRPGLAVIVIGENPASRVYVGHKIKACETVGIQSHVYAWPDTLKPEQLLQQIEKLNEDPQIHGILVQLPLPPGFDLQKIMMTIAPHKDVDGFHPENLGLLAQRTPRLRPCTPYGIIRLLIAEKIALKGQHAVVVGASNIVGRPMMLEFLNAGATATCCHRFTQNLQHHVSQADILVCAVGIPGLIPGDWIKPGAVVIDVGITRLANGELCGDIDFAGASLRASAITPVPGGVGPMTVAQLMDNTVQAARL